MAKSFTPAKGGRETPKVTSTDSIHSPTLCFTVKLTCLPLFTLAEQQSSQGMLSRGGPISVEAEATQEVQRCCGKSLKYLEQRFSD